MTEPKRLLVEDNKPLLNWRGLSGQKAARTHPLDALGDLPAPAFENSEGNGSEMFPKVITVAGWGCDRLHYADDPCTDDTPRVYFNSTRERSIEVGEVALTPERAEQLALRLLAAAAYARTHP